MFKSIKNISNNLVNCNQKKIMKNTILFALILLSFSSLAQYSYEYAPPKGWKSPELYLPATILVSTFTINHELGKSVSYGTRSTIAVTGIATSVASHFLFRKIREKRTNKKVIYKL